MTICTPVLVFNPKAGGLSVLQVPFGDDFLGYSNFPLHIIGTAQGKL